MSATIAWSRLGLTRNPFENVLPGERLEWVDWPPGLLELLERPRIALQLVGPHKGAGKSTVLRACQARLQDAGSRTHFVYVPLTARWRDPIPPDIDALLVDEADRLSWLGWRKVAKFRARGGSVLLGTHRHAPLEGFSTFELEPLRLRAWIEKRCAAYGWASLPPELSVLLPAIERVADGVNYRIQRLLYELLEDWVRGMPPDLAGLTRSAARLPAD